MTTDREFRAATGLEIRAGENGGAVVEGYAAVFGEITEIGDMFRERIEPGAFARSIARGDDVVFLINHGGLPLARTRAGTLILTEDDRGLRMRTELDPEDPDVRSILPKMRRGDLDKMSFAFWPRVQEWDDTGETPLRTIVEADLFDVSIVTTPQYDGTEIGLRSLEKFRTDQRQRNADAARRRILRKRNLIDRLTGRSEG